MAAGCLMKFLKYIPMHLIMSTPAVEMRQVQARPTLPLSAASARKMGKKGVWDCAGK